MFTYNLFYFYPFVTNMRILVIHVLSGGICSQHDLHLQCLLLSATIHTCGNFIIHYKACIIHSNKTIEVEKYCYDLSIDFVLIQIMDKPTHIPDTVGYHANLLNGFTPAQKALSPNNKYQKKPNSQLWFMPECAVAMTHCKHYYHLYQREHISRILTTFRTVYNH